VSDEDVTVVEISVSPGDAAVRADAVRDWLLTTGVIAPNPSRGLEQPSAYLAGPEAVAHTTDAAEIPALRNTGVDLITGRMVFDSAENVTPPDCPSCATPLDIDQYIDQLEPWLLAGEPVVRCPACEHSARLGDWPGEWTCQVGNLGVRFNNWPPLRNDFVRALGQRLGPRWRVVRAHR
jgi:hypothetical protein